MTREELITSDTYLTGLSELIIRSGRSVKEMRKEMNEYLLRLRDEFIEIGKSKSVPVGDEKK